MDAGLKPNPVRKHGDRDLDCPYYDDCLDRAAIANWNDFTCEECPMYHPETAISPAVGQSEPALPPTYLLRPALADKKPPTAGAGRTNGSGNGSGPAPAFTRQIREEKPMNDTPKCKRHPDRDAKLRTDGVSTGLCPECLAERNEKARQARIASGKKPGSNPSATAGPDLSPAQAAKQMAIMAPVLKGRVASLRASLAEGVYNELATASQGVLAVLDIMGEAGALPGWADK